MKITQCYCTGFVSDKCIPIDKSGIDETTVSGGSGVEIGKFACINLHNEKSSKY